MCGVRSPPFIGQDGDTLCPVCYAKCLAAEMGPLDRPRVHPGPEVVMPRSVKKKPVKAPPKKPVKKVDKKAPPKKEKPTAWDKLDNPELD
jgi:cell division septation protein DedD